MSEETLSYMEELNQWIDANVISPVLQVASDARMPDYEEQKIIAMVKHAIREKVRDSFHNGQAAGPRIGGGRTGGQYGR
jgi:hypothetical protein